LFIFFVVLAIAIAALFLPVAVIGPKGVNGINGVDGTNGIDGINGTNGTDSVDIVITDNQTLTPLINQTLKIFGISGITTSIENTDEITINNLRDVSKYIVNCDGTSQFLTPQDAYNTAVADGKGGTGPPALIVIAPCIYDFGSTLFQITTPGIDWVSLSPNVIGYNYVIFTASSNTGGIEIDVPFNLSLGVSFIGIKFGLLGDTNGFLLNHIQGAFTLDKCSTHIANMRIITNGFLFITSSLFFVWPPYNFIKTVSNSAYVFIESTNINDLGSGTTGGFVFDLSDGVNQVQLKSSFIETSTYEAVFKGPTGSSTGLVIVDYTFVSVSFNFGNPLGSFFRQSGISNIQISSSTFQLMASLIYQNEDSSPGDVHKLLCVNSNIVTQAEAIIENDVNVTIIGQCDYQFFNTKMTAVTDPYVINIPAASGTDLFNVIFVGVSIQSTSPPLGDYATGPSPFSSIQVGSSTCINGATNANGFIYTALQSI
jgi:hypothetical protein